MATGTKQTEKAFFLFEYLWVEDNRAVSQGRQAELLQLDRQAMQAVGRLAAGGHAWARSFLRSRDRHGRVPRAYLHLVPIAEPDYRAALRSQERYLSLAVIRERWRRFCRNNSVDAGAVMLPVDWEQGWRFLVEDERRAVELWERRRAKTLEMMARAKAAAEAASTPEAVEAARVKALTPGQREAESNARMDVMSARYAESDARTAFLKLINQRSPRSPEPERQAAREAIGLAEAERDRLEANHKRIVEVHRLANAKRRRPLQSHDRKHEPPAGSWVAEHERAEKVRQADAAWLRSLGKKARKVELEKRRAAMFAAYEAQRARSDRIRAMNEARRARMAAEAAREARKH